MTYSKEQLKHFLEYQEREIRNYTASLNVACQMRDLLLQELNKLKDSK